MNGIAVFKMLIDGSIVAKAQMATISDVNSATQTVHKIVSEVDRWKLGDPRDLTVNIGPVISPNAAARINDLVLDAVSQGGEILKGSKSQFGLKSCVFTRDFSRMWHLARALQCGEVTINDCPSHGVG